MTADELINEYAIEYPRVFIKLISLRAPLSKQDILNHEGVLELGPYGVQFNPHVQFDDQLRQFFGNRIITRVNEYHFQNFNSVAELKKQYQRKPFYRELNRFSLQRWSQQYKSLYKGRNYFFYDEITADYLREFGNELNTWHWRIITEQFRHPISFELFHEFRDKWAFNALLNNPNLDWSDVRLFKELAKDWSIINFWLPYELGIKPIWSPVLLDRAIDIFKKQLPISGKIVWSMPEKQKYLMILYVRGSGDEQTIGSYYFISAVPLQRNLKFRISNEVKIETNSRSIKFLVNDIEMNPFEKNLYVEVDNSNNLV